MEIRYRVPWQSADTKKSSSTLLTDTHYENISYGQNINAGTGTVSITGKGNYSGTAVKTFTVYPKPLTASMISVPGDYIYNGTQIMPTISVSDELGLLHYESDYGSLAYDNNINAGDSAVVQITGQGNYTGTVGQSFTILPKELTAAMITVNGDYPLTYNGAVQNPEIAVSDGSLGTLKPEIDFIGLTYAGDCENAGIDNAKVAITGIGNYTGTAERSFSVNPKPLSEDMLTVNGAYYYNGLEQEPGIIVEDKALERFLTEADYQDVSYFNNINAGQASVSITGKGNYSGIIRQSFEINPQMLDITGFDISKTYDGNNAISSFGNLSFIGLAETETAAVNSGNVFAEYDSETAAHITFPLPVILRWPGEQPFPVIIL